MDALRTLKFWVFVMALIHMRLFTQLGRLDRPNFATAYSLFSAKLWLVLIIVTLGGCSQMPSKRNIIQTETFETEVNKLSRLAVIADFCMWRDVIGKAHDFDLEASNSLRAAMVEGARTMLETKGYYVDKGLSPSDSCIVRAEGDVQAPEEQINSDGLDNALRELYFAANTHVNSSIVLEFARCCEREETLNVIRSVQNHLQSEDILLIFGSGYTASAGKSIGVGLITISLAAATRLAAPNPFLLQPTVYSHAVLIDGETGTVLWSNLLSEQSFRANNADFYQGKWAEELFFHFPLKNSDTAAETLSN